VAARASIVGAAETNVGKVRNHNEDSHFVDPERGIFLVCDGMGGHAAGEVASELAVQTVRDNWLSAATQALAEQWLAQGTAEAHRRLIGAIHDGARAAHEAILAEATRDRTKGGMGTTLVGAILVGGELVFAHCGDSRAYLVRDGIAMQLTEDHTLLARLLAAGVDVDVEGDGSRFKSMLTNALGIGQECKVGTFVVPLADGDRFLLCSDGITEYVPEPEIGKVLCEQASPARAAQRLVELALERGGGDNATAVVVRVLEAGESARPDGLRRKEEVAIGSCALWAKITPQQRLRALRIALPRDHASGERIAALALGDRVAWIIVDGEVEQDGVRLGPGALLYPEALLADRPLPDRDGLAVARGEVRTLAIRADDFRELCDDDAELGEALLDALGTELGARAQPSGTRRTGKVVVEGDADEHGATLPGIRAEAPIGGDAVPMPVDDGGAPAEVAAAPPDEPEEPEIEMISEPEPEVAAAVVAAGEPTQRMRPFGRRASVERLILKQDERVAAAADLEDALTRLTLAQEPAEQDQAEPELEPEPSPDHSEPEISIEPFLHAEVLAAIEPHLHAEVVAAGHVSSPSIAAAPAGQGAPPPIAPPAAGHVSSPSIEAAPPGRGSLPSILSPPAGKGALPSIAPLPAGKGALPSIAPLPAGRGSPPSIEPHVLPAGHRSPLALDARNGGRSSDPGPPAPDAPGEEPEEIVLTVQDESERIVEVVQDDSSQTLTLTVDD
jgi:serine/threonine protein phosphatase PrpC